MQHPRKLWKCRQIIIVNSKLSISVAAIINYSPSLCVCVGGGGCNKTIYFSFYNLLTFDNILLRLSIKLWWLNCGTIIIFIGKSFSGKYHRGIVCCYTAKHYKELIAIRFTRCKHDGHFSVPLLPLVRFRHTDRAGGRFSWPVVLSLTTTVFPMFIPATEFRKSVVSELQAKQDARKDASPTKFRKSRQTVELHSSVSFKNCSKSAIYI